MLITNLSFEFYIQYQKVNSEVNFKLAKRKLNFFKLDTRNINLNFSMGGIRYFSNIGRSNELMIIRTAQKNEKVIESELNLHKDTFLIYKNDCLIGAVETLSHQMGENGFHLIQFFVKKMNYEEIRITLEFLLPINLNSKMVSIKDSILQYISSRPNPSFQREVPKPYWN